MAMELETAKKLIRQYAAGHTDYMQKCAIAERYYRNETDVLYQKKEYGDDDGNPLRNADNRIPRNIQRTAWNYVLMLPICQLDGSITGIMVTVLNGR